MRALHIAKSSQILPLSKDLNYIIQGKENIMSTMKATSAKSVSAEYYGQYPEKTIDVNSTNEAAADRRKDQDLLGKSLKWFSIVSWAITYVIFLIVDEGNKIAGNFLSTTATHNYRFSGITEHLLFGLLVIGLIISGTGIIINFKRARRKSEKLRFSLVLPGLISLTGLIFFSI